MNNKMLTLAKISLAKFVYDETDVFAFPNEYVRDIFDKNDIIKCHIHLILTDTDSTSLFFFFFCCFLFLFLRVKYTVP